MQYIAIFHANLNYAYLTPDRYEFVIRESYELILDTMRERFPDVPFVFEASGYTIEEMARRTPDVLDKLKAAIASGRCEFMGSPHAHPMLPNFPEPDGLWSLRFALETFERHLGVRPRSFWNPECGWRRYVPRIVRDAGFANLIGDFEAYSRSLGPDGLPQRPEIYEKEYTDKPGFYRFGFEYDLPGDEPAIHFPFDKVDGVEPGQLRMMLRTDRVAQFGVRYFMGMEGYSLEDYLALVRKYSAQPAGESEGALIIFADDAEYVGTNGWFKLKYQNQPDAVFERTPGSREKLIALIEGCLQMGSFTTFDAACSQLPPLPQPVYFDDDTAWHGGRASTWASTPFAHLLRPWQDLVRDKLNAAADMPEARRRQVWLHLTNSYNSDGQWPPTLPDAPHIVHPFNYAYCFENLLMAEMLVGGVDRSRLETDAAASVEAILGLQLGLIEKKAAALAEQGAAPDLIERVRNLLAVAGDLDALRGRSILYPAEYRVRADAMVDARRLVGGVLIEKVAA